MVSSSVIGSGRFGWLRRLAAVALGAGAMFVGTTLLAARGDNNLHAVVPGTVYRSAQPAPADLDGYRASLGLRSVINLRGAHPGASWYDAEVRKAAQLGIHHLDFAMEAHTELTPQEVLRLVRLMRDAPKPLLIHCKAGADRTGLAAALYLAMLDNAPEETAEDQLALRFGHVAIPILGAFAMDATFETMEPLIGFAGR